MLQFKTQIITASLQSNIDFFRIDKAIGKKNVLKFTTKQNKTYVYFWENNEKIIEWINIPIKPNSKKPIYDVYEANEALRMVKIGFDDGDRFICVNE